MDGAGPPAGLVRPRDAALDREVDLEGARPVPVAAVGARDPRAAAARRRSRRPPPGARSSTTASAVGQLGERVDPRAGLDRAAVLAQHRGQRVGDRARAAPRRPASRRRGRRRSAPSRPTELIGRLSGLNACAATPPKSARACARLASAARAPSPAPPRGGRSAPAAAGACGDVEHRAQEVLVERVEATPTGAPNSRRQARAVRAQALGRLLDRAQHHPGAAVVERVGEVDLGPAPLEAVARRGRASAGTASRPPSGARPSSGRGGRPGTVSSLRPRAAADRLRGLEHGHLDALARERDRAGEPVRAGADDDRVAHATCAAAAARRCRRRRRPRPGSRTTRRARAGARPCRERRPSPPRSARSAAS